MSGPRVVVLTAAKVEQLLTALRAAEHTWKELVDRHGSLDLLRDEIDQYEWLLGDAA